MIALLRYAYLKGLRDSSLIAFLAIEMLVPVAALAGVTLGKGHFQYPFYLDIHNSPVQNATMAGQVTTGICIFFTVITAFWTFRSEVATRSVGSFLLATRPLTLALALVLFAAAIGVVGWIGGMAMIAVLTTAVPSQLAMLALKVVAGTVAASAFGTLMVSISPNPGMIVAAYLLAVMSFVWVEKSKSVSPLIAGVAFAIICAAFAAFFLERRCAT